MKPSKGFWITLGSGVGVVFLTFGLYVWLTPCNGVKQRLNMLAADEYIETVRPRIVLEARFAEVTLSPFTGGKCGCLYVHGSVASKGDLEALKVVIENGRPSVEVKYSVTVGEPEE